MGGGQLGRMFTAEALRMGYRVVVYDPDQKSPAGLIASYHICAPYDEPHALDEMIELCDAVTIEFENLPVESLEYIAERMPLSPSPENVGIAQNRIKEKTFFKDNGLATPNFAPVLQMEDISSALQVTGLPCIIKTTQFGYDGKGQEVCSNEEDVRTAFERLGRVSCILEQKIELAKEVSVILARRSDGEIVPFPLAENQHVKGVLDTTVVPADVTDIQHRQAMSLAHKLADDLDYVGVLAVELFISTSGDVLINEIAPRPHNSGHFTQNATDTSQFEQQVRMMADLPAGNAESTRSVAMLNLLGDLWGESVPRWEEVFSVEGAYLHLYAKHEARPGRKMGHINIVGNNPSQLLKKAHQLKQKLSPTSV